MPGYIPTAGGTATPWSPQQAALYAISQVDSPDQNYKGLCDRFVARCYGYFGSGYVSARVHFRDIPSRLVRRVTDWDAVPLASPLYWPDLGVWGHTALIVKPGGIIASNDIRRTGLIDLVHGSTIRNQWGGTAYYSLVPWFEDSYGSNPNPRPSRPKPVPRADWEQMGPKVDGRRTEANRLVQLTLGTNPDGVWKPKVDGAVFQRFGRNNGLTAGVDIFVRLGHHKDLYRPFVNGRAA